MHRFRFVAAAVVLLSIILAPTLVAELNWKERLSDYETRLKRATSDEERFMLLPATANSAFQFGDLERARAYAEESLQLAERYRNSWNYGNALHHGHLLRGHSALQRGDIERASNELLIAGDTPGSPQLDSFGPNMALAKALLERGQRQPVLMYLEKCRKFWEMGGQRLDQWKAEIEKGDIPDFGANLVY